MQLYMKIMGFLTGIICCGGFVYLGYRTFSGDPIFANGRNTEIFNRAQEWLIGQLGMTNAGLATMGVGGVLALLLIKEMFSRDEA